MTKLLDPFGFPLSDSYCTPRWLTALLPQVDVDPCSNTRSTVKARRTFSLEKKLDGLKLPWSGSVFCNFPYSDPMPWCAKLIEELKSGRCTEAIILCKLDTSTGWWRTLLSGGDPELWMFDKRICFDEPPALVAERIKKYTALGKSGGDKSSTNFSSTIIHYRVVQLEGGPAFAPALSLGSVATCWRRAA